jgi:hypothetical protein
VRKSFPYSAILIDSTLHKGMFIKDLRMLALKGLVLELL